MKTRNIFLAILAAMIFSAVTVAEAAWIADYRGVMLWNPQPTDGETIEWSGGYVQEGNYRYAEGRGTVIWKRYGRVVQIDEGGFSRGRHHGSFKHTFYPSGRVEYSYWNHGVEV